MNRGEEKGPKTAETSFTEGDTNYSRVITSNKRALDSLSRIFPETKASELEVSCSKRGRLQVKMFGQGKSTSPLYTEEKGTNKQRLNPSVPNQIKTSLGSEKEVFIAEKEKEIEGKQKSIQENRGIDDDENEDRVTRERARIIENQERIDAVENEREELEEGTSLRERVRNIFKKYGFTVATIVLAVGTAIGVTFSSLTRGLSSATQSRTLRPDQLRSIPHLPYLVLSHLLPLFHLS